MRSTWIATCLAISLFTADASADDQAQKKAVAVDKAQVLEQKAAEKGSEAPVAKKAEAITPAEVQAVDPAGQAPLDDAITCLARSIYWEAKGKDTADMEGVANVVMNRLGHEGFPDTVCGIVKQGSEKHACQFSWWCDGRSDDVQEAEPYATAKEVARKALNKQLPDRTHGAMYFHDRNVNPAWAKAYIKTVEIGRFLFYKPRNGEAK
ncbi:MULTISPECIES: cell wall hydrolase [unclassified Pseudomonas]|uniref:cell wall hydrolase n=1 Tax=unclassified Pseudomonas TaxID=196821 RepID=UPI002AC9B8F9|nr:MULTISPECIES: cell wall hydrolase [unclassified Pseudomonas]MEB0045540.1 cell wall hydrolase [Pseudomonas sp. Dout3]MEB0095423.1 cell wall hydrolase [Pseudomonas sp. DC1.2]WPX61007.1 cell wall hydrolase [Pseudomonas sp. DC1.2]